MNLAINYGYPFPINNKNGFLYSIVCVLKKPSFWILSFVFLALFFGVVDPAHAADATDGGGAGLPWEGPLMKLRQSISGPVAFIIALFGIICCGATLIWGGEISEFARRIIYLVLVISIIVFANSLLTGVMFSGAVVPDGVSISSADLKLHK